MAVGNVTVTKVRLSKTIEKISVVWTSSAGGAVSGNPINIGGGAVQQVKFIPGTAGVQPTNLYGVTVVDANGVDMIIGKGASLSNVNSSIGAQAAPLSWLSGGTLDVVVASAGNAKQGTVELIVQRL